MKVILLNDKDVKNKKVGGAELFILSLSKKLLDPIIISNPVGTINNKILRKLFFDYFNPLNYIFLYRKLKKISFDIIHLNNFYGISLNTIKKIYNRYPCIITIHDSRILNYSTRLPNFINKIHRNLYLKNLNSFQLVCPSKFLYDKLKSIGYTHIFIIPNGVNISKKPTNYSKKILYTSRIEVGKGLQTIINTLNNLRDYEILVLGEGPLKKELESKYKNIKFLGFQKPDEYYKNANILVMPSLLQENQPLSILEAMSYGLCVIASNIGGIPEIVKHMETGLLFEPGNEQDFKEKLDYLLKNPKEIKRMGKNARKFVKKNHDWNKIVKQYEELYRQVIEEHKKKIRK